MTLVETLKSQTETELWPNKPIYHINMPTDSKIQEKAKTEAKELGNLRGSIEDGGGNFAGLLAEFAVAIAIGAVRKPTYEYDIVRNGISIDVKTKRRTVPPKPRYEASIADFNTEQNADVYYFANYNTKTEKISLLGYIGTDRYYELATYHEEGDYDPDNDFYFKADCYNLEYEALQQTDLRWLNETGLGKENAQLQ